MKKYLFIVAAVALANAAPQWIIEGDATDENGPMAGVEITALGPASASATTNAKGHYVLNGAKPGTYRIFTQNANDDSRHVNVSAGGRVTNIDFRIGREAVISGHVLDADKNPVGGAAVTLYAKHFAKDRSKSEVRGTAVTNALGEYRIAGLRAGRYYMRADSTGVRFQSGELASPAAEPKPVLASVRTYFPNAATFDSASAIYLSSGEQRDRVELTLNQDFTYCLNGTVAEDPSGMQGPVSLRVEEVSSSWLASVAIGTLKPGDRFAVCGLSPGSYDIWLATANRDSPTKIAGFTSREFTIGKHPVALGTLYLEPPLTLRGKVTIIGKDEKDPAPTGIILRLRFLNRSNGIGNESTVASVNSSGDFVFPSLFSDGFGFDIQGLPRGFYVKQVIQGGRDVTRAQVRPDGGDLSVIVSADGPTIYGEAVDREGNQAADATVLFSSKEQSGAVISDQNGKFEMSGLSPGKYSILCLTGLLDGEETDPEVIRSPVSGATNLLAEAGQSTSIRLLARPAHP